LTEPRPRAAELPDGGAFDPSDWSPADPHASWPPGTPPQAILDRWAVAAATAGLEALRGRPGATADMLVLAVATALHHLDRVADVAEGAVMARRVLTNGAALERWTSAAPGDSQSTGPVR